MSRWSALALIPLGLSACTAPAAPPPSGPAAGEVGVERPLPHPVAPPREFQTAIARGTRTATGEPGPRYWQNRAEYRIESRLQPEAKRVDGTSRIRYHNQSPDTLNRLVLDVDLNLHAEGAVRMEAAEVTGGVELKRVTVAGTALRTGIAQGPRYTVQGTKVILVPGEPVAPGETAEIEVDWGYRLPRAGAGERMGYDSDNLIFLAYWTPRMAVYDDVGGWHMDPFLASSEFYHGFGSWDVTLDVPQGWLVRGTGRLVNEEEVLAAPVLERLRAAEGSDTVVRVLGRADLGRATRTSRDGRLRWRFQADSVRDIAYSVTRESLWDATRAAVGDRDGDGRTEYARVEALYREPAFRWTNAARYGQHSVRFLSEYTGIPYPWPHMTAVEGAGIMGGGMEYPMMTLIGDYSAAGDTALYNVTVHEIAHMWVPMIVSVDERRFSWMDEGFTTFHENEARADFHPGRNHHLDDQATYLRIARAGAEGEMMRRSAYHYPGPAFVVASYMKPATVLHALRGVLGEETFRRAYLEFMERWAFKGPQPWDLWNTFETVSGRDLDWFWTSWYHTTWTLDQAVASVEPGTAGTVITVRDEGNVPMPVRLTVTREGGETLEREIPVERWLSGARTATVTVPAGAPVVRVEIDPERGFPDVDRENNVWER